MNETCYICGRRACHHHHVFYGTANRRVSDEWGFIVALCYDHHEGPEGVHRNHELDLTVKRRMQAKFEETYLRKDFVQLIGRNYL
jgi:hypothetical protein